MSKNLEKQRLHLLALPCVSEDIAQDILMINFKVRTQFSRQAFLDSKNPCAIFMAQHERLIRATDYIFKEKIEVLKEIYNETYRYEILPGGQFANVGKKIFQG